MLDGTGMKKALTRLAAGIVFLCAFVFMLSEISTIANHVIVWSTGIIFVLYGLLQYRELKTVRAGAPEQSDLQKRFASPFPHGILKRLKLFAMWGGSSWVGWAVLTFQFDLSG